MASCGFTEGRILMILLSPHHGLMSYAFAFYFQWVLWRLRRTCETHHSLPPHLVTPHHTRCEDNTLACPPPVPRAVINGDGTSMSNMNPKMRSYYFCFGQQIIISFSGHLCNYCVGGCFHRGPFFRGKNASHISCRVDTLTMNSTGFCSSEQCSLCLQF